MISRDPPGAVNGSKAFSGKVESGLAQENAAFRGGVRWFLAFGTELTPSRLF
jgi:hypothetical protein